ncbi:MAG: type IV pili twitching motility protein PilT [Parcubacteria group bacterium GW2011_GWA2_38_13b]|nr:MAG: type IV pili twitching motility protein PilT [Parcubacteria group bacterium GW2011_GWA2_38_13b]
MKDFQYELEELFVAVLKENASDLHISAGRYPTLRIDGQLISLAQKEILDPEHTRGLVLALLNEQQKELFLKNKELDFAYSFKGKARFRVNVFYQRCFFSAALRLIPTKIKTIEELNLPPILQEFTNHSQGFLLITGPTGHGKSTTLAALVDKINHERTKHIITIEDPIEYLFTQDRSIVDQREVGLDTDDFSRALRSVFRQDVDVIMVGEMRDIETISTAVTAAETGHLVLATLHTNNAAQTIDRIIDTFPPSGQGQIRAQLANTLLGVVSQRLIPKLDGGRIPAVEVMIANHAIRNLIREDKIHQIDLVIDTNMEAGMISLNRALAELVRAQKISMENAELYSLNLSELRNFIS